MPAPLASLEITGKKPTSEESGSRRLLRLDSRIRNQFDLITSRTGWLLTSHAFLFTAVAATLNGMVGTASASQMTMRAAILLLLPVIGAVSSFLVQRSVTAAYAIVEDVKKARDALLDYMCQMYGYECTNSRMFANAHFTWGDLPPKVFPVMMLIVWSFLFILACTIVFNDFRIILRM
ncbi:hypothetical protein GJV26_22240 [Massilia dura]|uniref:Uncharacterized protein n=1 Tax=Pseudoduganella dura TaxID=321982 RepID=A0A6I3XDZ5_9BURK|nr:hypothetical protein [Pseudoduganella dura]MUI15164.1 hypothetical protein [Pseudoduganella dura]GGY16634.1 hypothetical protein GCM10007386_53080 [Pseudoduganella dura]